jgi:hypothetical protein
MQLAVLIITQLVWVNVKKVPELGINLPYQLARAHLASL